ncbi:outer membrane lipoprotein carrier protein LolA [Zobellella sp. DQSA1]|uniref:LolA family protein n=1 Tax=Zobellella sp. DQSA1 TaxID=3342386 RepID=UPI0035C13BCB
MLSGVLLLMALALDSPDPLEQALARFDALQGYRLELRSEGPGGNQQLRYAYRKPGLVRLDVISPHAGAVLIYSPYSDRVRLWPFGLSGPSLTLSPDNRMVKSPRGHRLDRSDVGELLRQARRLGLQGEMRLLGESRLAERPVLQLLARGEAPPGQPARFEIWLDKILLFPVRVISHDARGNLLETVWLEHIEPDPSFADDFFFP